jgi:hypothetical protein
MSECEMCGNEVVIEARIKSPAGEEHLAFCSWRCASSYFGERDADEEAERDARERAGRESTETYARAMRLLKGD